MSQLPFEQRSDYPSYYDLIFPPTKTPVEAFQAELYNLINALQPHISPITDMLYANQFITSTTAYKINSSQCTDYDKAREIVYELLRQLKARKDSLEYLKRICDLFVSLNDPILRSITIDIMLESYSTLVRNRREAINLSIIGARDSGKSTLINGLLGKKKEKPCSWTQSSTQAPKEYPTAESFVFWGETQDTSSHNGYQQSEGHHLQHVKNAVTKANLSIYCIDMSAPFDFSAMTALDKYIRDNPEAVSKTIIALTKANAIKYPVECQKEEDKINYFEKRYQSYTKKIREFLKSRFVPEEKVDKLPFVPTGDYSPTMSHPRWLHAGRPDWSYLFWFTCMNRLLPH